MQPAGRMFETPGLYFKLTPTVIEKVYLKKDDHSNKDKNISTNCHFTVYEAHYQINKCTNRKQNFYISTVSGIF
jgi:hypothetical protein